MRRIAFFVLLLAAACDCAELPAGKKLSIYLLCGQSNMAGRGKVEAGDSMPHPRVFVFSEKNTWEPAKDPLHWDKPKIAGVGPGFSFAKQMAEAAPDTVIGLVPCAVGGTPIERWVPKADLFKAAVARAKEAVKAGALEGVLWHQGESNIGLSTAEYAGKLKQVVEGFRAELGLPELPFVAGTLGDFLKERANNVNAAILALPKNVPQTGAVEAQGLGHKGDNLHFDSPAQRELGRRYAEAMAKLKK